MNIFSPKKEVTLESISNSIDFMMTKVAMKDDLKKLEAGLETRLVKRMDDLVDGLAVAVHKGFVATDARIDALEQKMDEKINRLDTRMMGQFDYIMVNYPTREEIKVIDLRTKKLERRVFA